MAKLKVEGRFGVIPHNVLYDANISLKAKGLYAYMQSKPDGWEFSAERISNECSEGRDAVRAALIELETAGYLTRYRKKNELGQWEWEHVLLEKPSADNSTADNSTADNTAIKEEGVSKKESVKRSSLCDTSVSQSQLVQNERQLREERAREVINMEAEVTKLRESNSKHLKVIGRYLNAKNKRFGYTIKTRGQFNLTIKRHLRDAKAVADSIADPSQFDVALAKAFERVGDEATISTAIKYLTK